MEEGKLAQPFFKNASQSLNFALWRDFNGFLYPNIPQLCSNWLKANFCVNKGGLGFGVEKRKVNPFSCNLLQGVEGGEKVMQDLMLLNGKPRATLIQRFDMRVMVIGPRGRKSLTFEV